MALGSGLALAAAERFWESDQFPSWRALTAVAMVWAWLTEGMRCGATTMLRCLLGSCRSTIRLWARNSCTASVELSAFAMSPSNAVDSLESATTAVVPPPMGRAAVGV